jgi:hypothetical protein
MPASSSSEGCRRAPRRHQDVNKRRQVGSWLPLPVVEKVCRLDLRPASRWPVLMAILFTACRYGSSEARLSVADLARMTGLSPRTVKASVADLMRRGLIARSGRYERLRVLLTEHLHDNRGAAKVAPPGADLTPERGAEKLAPRRCREACTSPTSLYSFLLEDNGKGPFSAKQRQTVADVLTEASDLLGSDAGHLPLPEVHAVRLGLPLQTTFAQALATIIDSGNRRQARDLTRAVLALRYDARVQGDELKLYQQEPG